jgi:DNA-3-methyladenine glycosylase I
MIPKRCTWCAGDTLYTAYHDKEWGVPLHAERRLFEMLILEGAQAGLSWLTILRKRDDYRRAFHDFDPARVARYGARDEARLLANTGIVRNLLKIQAAITNARAYLRLCEEEGSLDRFLWQFVNSVPRQNAWRSLAAIPVRTRESEQLSKVLRGKGFRFVGATICYAYMQSIGMVNDHVVDCFRYREIADLVRK